MTVTRPIIHACVILLSVSSTSCFIVDYAADTMQRGHDETNQVEAIEIAEMLFDSCEVGLGMYFELEGTLPMDTNEYFFNKIKYFIGDMSVYVCKNHYLYNGQHIGYDSFIGPGTDSYLLTDSCYLGPGFCQAPVKFRYVKENEGLLYWEGRNQRDDFGEGDDIVRRVKFATLN